MKKYVIVVFMVLVGTAAYPQEIYDTFLKEGKVWTCTLQGYLFEFDRFIEGDTVIADIPCKKMYTRNLIGDGKVYYAGAYLEKEGDLYRIATPLESAADYVMRFSYQDGERYGRNLFYVDTLCVRGRYYRRVGIVAYDDMNTYYANGEYRELQIAVGGIGTLQMNHMRFPFNNIIGLVHFFTSCSDGGELLFDRDDFYTPTPRTSRRVDRTEGFDVAHSVAFPEAMTSLTVTGILNGKDIAYIREMAVHHGLKQVHLGGACMVEDADEEAPSAEDYVDGLSGCNVVERMVLPQVKEVGPGAMENCPNLQEVELPEGVERVGSRAFAECVSLRQVKSDSMEPPVCAEDAFEGINTEECTLVVPVGAARSYRRANVWRNFYIEEADLLGVKPVRAATEGPQIYNLQGIRQTELQPGVNIVRSADGTVKKIVK